MLRKRVRELESAVAKKEAEGKRKNKYVPLSDLFPLCFFDGKLT